MRKYALKSVKTAGIGKFPYVEVDPNRSSSFNYTRTLDKATLFNSIEAALAALIARVQWTERSGSPAIYRNDRFTVIAVETSVTTREVLL